MASVGLTLNLDLNPDIPPNTPTFPLHSLLFGGLLVSESAPNTCCPRPCFSGTLASAGHTGQGVLALVDLDFRILSLDGLLTLSLPGPQALEGEGGIVEFRLVVRHAWGCGKGFFLVL